MKNKSTSTSFLICVAICQEISSTTVSYLSLLKNLTRKFADSQTYGSGKCDRRVHSHDPCDLPTMQGRDRSRRKLPQPDKKYKKLQSRAQAPISAVRDQSRFNPSSGRNSVGNRCVSSNCRFLQAPLCVPVHSSNIWKTRFYLDRERGYLSSFLEEQVRNKTSNSIDWRNLYRNTKPAEYDDEIPEHDEKLNSRARHWKQNKWLKDRYRMVRSINPSFCQNQKHRLKGLSWEMVQG